MTDNDLDLEQASDLETSSSTTSAVLLSSPAVAVPVQIQLNMFSLNVLYTKQASLWPKTELKSVCETLYCTANYLNMLNHHTVYSRLP